MKVEEILNGQNPEEIYAKHKYFPGDLLWEDEHFFHIVIGVKGDGKSFWKLLKMIDVWKDGKHTVEIIQTKEKIKELMKFQDYFDRLLAPGEEDETKQEWLDFLDGLEYRDSSIWKDGRIVVKFVPMMGMDKNKDLVGANTGWIVEDETFKDRYEKNTAYAFMLIIDTIFRKRSDIKITLLGNAISLNHPMFVALGMYQLNDDIITLHKGEQTGKLMLKVWNWKRPIGEIKDSYGDSPLFDLFTETGYGDFAFKNEFKNDNLDNIVPWSEMKDSEEYLDLLHTFKVREVYVDVFYIKREHNSTGRAIYYYRINRDKQAISKVKFALSRDDVTDKIKYSPTIADELATRLQNNTMYYDSVVTKQSLWETIRTRF